MLQGSRVPPTVQNKFLLKIRHPQKRQDWANSSVDLHFQESLTPSVAQTSPFLSTLERLNVTERPPSPAERQQFIKKANVIGANYWQVAYQEAGQELLRMAFEESKDAEVFESLDSEYVKDLYSKKDLKRSELRELYNLGGIITWLSFG